jgi:hypothetical protein
MIKDALIGSNLKLVGTETKELSGNTMFNSKIVSYKLSDNNQLVTIALADLTINGAVPKGMENQNRSYQFFKDDIDLMLRGETTSEGFSISK